MNRRPGRVGVVSVQRGFVFSPQNGLPFLVPAVMHRDAKLGLALGILVIGFAAAFCFPRHAGLPAHARTEAAKSELDERLALRSVRVYTNARHPAETIEPAPPVLPASPPLTAVEPDVPVVVDSRYLTGPGGTGPSAVRPQTRGESGDSTLSHDDEENAPIDDAEPVGITHTVRPGDTLSSIALQHLGGSSRYAEVFELNRDLLASPDALQIGMELKIPPKVVARASSPAIDRPRSAPTQIADSRPDRHFGDRIETDSSRSSVQSRQEADPPSAGPSPREREPTLAEPYLPTTAIPAIAPRVEPPAPPSGSAPARRGAASVGASLWNRRA